MQKTIMAAMAAASLIAIAGCNKQPAANGNASTETAAVGADAINGTWKADIDSVQFESKPDDYLLQNGTYSCKSCTPAYSVAADGAFHPVSLPYADSDSVKVVDDHTITETSKKAGKEMGETTLTVSADGKTLDGKFTDTSAPGAPSKGEFTETRVGPAPAGAHAISGQWKPDKLSNFNDAALTFTINVSGDTLHSSSPGGTSFDAKIGGGDVPIQGDVAGTTVSVTKSGDNGYQETYKRDGKTVAVTTLSVGADGKLSGANENKLNGSTTKWTATKQS
jgi:hypothetical protein